MSFFSKFSRNKTVSESASTPPAVSPAPDPAPASPHPLDSVTGGIFSADNSTRRQERVLQWLATHPEPALLQQVYKALSARDQGAAKPIRQRMNDIRQSQQQEATSQDWAERAQKILSAPNFHIADGMAWLRDAAKAGAPLSKEPLASLRGNIAEQVKTLEELQHKAMVQKEAAVLLAQRIDVLSTKSWQHADSAQASLSADVQKWSDHAQELTQAPLWGSVEPRHASALESSRVQLQQVFDAFNGALEQARQASTDPKAPLPQVQVWADELRQARGEAAVPEAAQARVLTPEQIQQIEEVLQQLEKTLQHGQARESGQAAAALRASLKGLVGSVDADMERRINQALINAGDLQGWQRWGANQVREELISRAEKLMDSGEGHTPPSGKNLQIQVRELHEQWRQIDRSSPPNGHLWNRFDEAISKARVVVDEWLQKVKAEAQAHKAERQTLIDEVQAYAQSQSEALDLKALQRQLQQFVNRWRHAGHVNDKVFSAMQAQWKQAYDSAAAPLEAARRQSSDVRRAMIEEAREIAAGPLDIRAIKALQQRWQAEAQRVPLERKAEQKFWDAFRQPLDEAFQKKGEQRQQEQAATSAHDLLVLEASQALENAIAGGSAQAIRDAMHALQDALHAAPQAVQQTPLKAHEAPAAGAAPEAEAAAAAPEADSASPVEPETAPEQASSETSEPAPGSDDATAEAQPADDVQPPSAPAIPPAPARQVIAVRGDDRPGAQPAGKEHTRATRPGDARRPERGGARERFGRDERDSRDSRDTRRERAPAPPRLGDRAFRAQRHALENAQMALKKLSAQAHGEAVGQLLDAWKQRDASALPAPATLSRKISASQFGQWKSSLGEAAREDKQAGIALLRIEIAAEVPTPASFISERRALQLQLLTQKHAASPAETWATDLATVLATPANDTSSQRLQSALKVLLKRG